MRTVLTDRTYGISYGILEPFHATDFGRRHLTLTLPPVIKVSDIQPIISFNDCPVKWRPKEPILRLILTGRKPFVSRENGLSEM
jgi:hypothetical protein